MSLQCCDINIYDKYYLQLKSASNDQKVNLSHIFLFHPKLAKRLTCLRLIAALNY